MNSKLRMVQALCLASMLTFVPAILCAVTVASGYAAYLEFKDWQWRRANATGNSTYETLVVDSQGRVAVAVHESRSKSVRYLDERRRPLAVDEIETWLEGRWLFREPQPVHPLQRPQDFPAVSLGSPVKDEDWYFVRDGGPDRRAVFEAYDTVTHKRIGFIGVDGFKAGPRDESMAFPIKSPMRWGVEQILFSRSDFESHMRSRGVRGDSGDVLRVGQSVLLSDERLFVVDLVARSATDLMPGIPVRSMAAAVRIVPVSPARALPAQAGGAQQGEYQNWLAVRTDDNVILINPSAEKREEYLLPPEWRERQFQLYLPADGSAVLTYHAAADQVRDIQPGIREYDVDLVTITPVGEVARKMHLTLQMSYSGATPPKPGELAMHWLPTIAIPGPLPSALIAGGALPWLDAYVNQTRFTDRVAVSLGQTWPLLALVSLLAAGLAWRVDRHLRACREPRSFLWLSFVFLLGLPGYVAWYCHRRWPVRHPVAPPEKTGTEIFA